MIIILLQILLPFKKKIQTEEGHAVWQFMTLSVSTSNLGILEASVIRIYLQWVEVKTKGLMNIKCTDIRTRVEQTECDWKLAPSE